MRNRKQNILLVTGNDDTYRKVLLENQGYCVTPVHAGEVLAALQQKEFHFVLFASESGLSNEKWFCHHLRTNHPKLRIGVVAQHGQRIPLESCADVVIRAQYSPAAFIGAVNTILMHEQHAD